jgi:5-methylcytosine-specific restriction endonuclease McrA
MNFESREDAQYFENLLCESGEDLSKYESLFDFRTPSVKRREFGRERARLCAALLIQYGQVCQLRYSDKCNIASGIVLDHLIPLSSNKLNKELRHVSAFPGRKVASQSFGSNHANNLILACCNCNNHKKHRLLTREQLKPLLRLKGL